MSHNTYNNNNNNYQSNQQNMSDYYGDQSNQRNLATLGTANTSTRSLGGATAIGTPRVNPTEHADEIDSINSQSLWYSQQHDAYNRDEGESRPVSVLTKKDSRGQLVGQNDQGNQYYPGYSKSNPFGGFFQQHKYQRHEDPYYDDEATRHNTLTSEDPFNHGQDYTDRDFPGGGKGARMAGEYLTMPDIKRRKRCCGCCTWPVCILVTIIILVSLGIIAFFVLPRIPTINIQDPIPASAPILNPPLINVNFTIPVEIDNEKNYVPYKFNKIDVSVYDRNANNSSPVATGTQTDYTLQPKRNDTIYFPIMVNYTGQSSSDPVIEDFINACSPQVTNHIPLQLKVDVVLYIWGIDWFYKPTISVPVPNVNCPKVI